MISTAHFVDHRPAKVPCLISGTGQPETRDISNDSSASLYPATEAARNKALTSIYQTAGGQFEMHSEGVHVKQPLEFLQVLKSLAAQNVKRHMDSTGTYSTMWGANKNMNDKEIGQHVHETVAMMCPDAPDALDMQLGYPSRKVSMSASSIGDMRWTKSDSDSFNCSVAFLAPYVIGDASEWKDQRHLTGQVPLTVPGQTVDQDNMFGVVLASMLIGGGLFIMSQR
jgi:hypothetical protein